MQPRKAFARFTAGLLLVTSLITPAFAATGIVNAGGSTLRVRDEASTAGGILDNLPDGAYVEVLSNVSNGAWYRISHEGVTGYVSGEYLTVDAAEAAALPAEQEPFYVKVTTSSLNVRAGAGTNFDKVGKLSMGRVVKVVAQVNGWYQIEDGGFISAEYAVKVDASEAAANSATQAIVDYALSFVGYPYVYGGSSPSGFDCSGFTKYVYAHFGYHLNRSAAAQLDNGTPVSMGELQPGDLVMFRKGGSSKRASHVGLYIGGGRFVHASTARVGVIVSSLSEAYYTSGFVGGRRIV